MRRLITTLAFGVIGFCAFAEAQTINMSVASKCGLSFKGDLVAKGSEGRIEVLSLDYVLPANADAGEVLSVTTPFGRHLPSLLQAFTTNDVLSEVAIEILRPPPTGVAGSTSPVRTQTFLLRNARIVGLRVREQATAGSRGKVEVDFQYASIEVSHLPTGATALRDRR